MSSDEEDDEGEKRNPVGLVSVSLGRRVARTFSLPSRSVLSHLFFAVGRQAERRQQEGEVGPPAA